MSTLRRATGRFIDVEGRGGNRDGVGRGKKLWTAQNLACGQPRAAHVVKTCNTRETHVIIRVPAVIKTWGDAVRRESLGVCHGQSTVIGRVLRVGITGNSVCLAAYHWQMDFSVLRQCLGSTSAVEQPPTPMMTSSNGNIFRVTGPLCGEFTGPGEFPTQRPVTRSFDVFFDLRLNKRLSKQPWGWWFETLSWSLWRQCNDSPCKARPSQNWPKLTTYYHVHQTFITSCTWFKRAVLCDRGLNQRQKLLTKWHKYRRQHKGGIEDNKFKSPYPIHLRVGK